MITAIEQQTSDFDWFFTNGFEIGFVASGGGKLPDAVAILDEKLDELIKYFRNLSKKGEVILHNAEDHNISELTDWIDMAEKGLFAYDKTVLSNFSDLNYHLVAQPSNPISMNDLLPEIIETLRPTKIDFKMGAHLNLELFNER